MRLTNLLVLLATVASANPVTKREPAPLLVPGGDMIADKYIVKLREGSPLAAIEDAMKLLGGGKADNVFKNVFQGFSAQLNKATLAALRMHPDVEYIEHDGVASAYGFITQSSSTWGLARVSHRNKGSNSYTYDESAGSGTCAYIVDSGVDASHSEFEGRAKQIKSFEGGTTDDCGHGTHVAGTVGSKTYGVAKKTNIYGVKVLAKNSKGECVGAWSSITSGLDFVAEDAPKRNCPNGVVVNMSLGGQGTQQALNQAVDNLVKKGYFVSVAAGNSNQDAGGFSPAMVKSACTVGGTQSDDQRYNNSNYGTVVDILAPGVDVLSTTPGGRTASYTGTSMAAPHVCGLAAVLASQTGIKASGASCDKLREMATKNKISGFPSSTVNLLAFNGNPSG